MAASSETPSVTEQMAHSTLLNIKANQNLILELEPSKYDAFLQLLIECPRYSPLVIALMKTKNVPLVHLSKAYSTASYLKEVEKITFEIGNHKPTYLSLGSVACWVFLKVVT